MPEKLKSENEDEMIKEIKQNMWSKGKFVGHKKTLIETCNRNFPYAIIHQCDIFGQDLELYKSLNDAVYDFVELMKVYG